MTLQEIGLKHGTDKASHHHYLPLYELLFRHLKDKHIWILEIGVQFGNSLRTWEDYFPFARVVGIDSVDNNFDSRPGVQAIIADAYSIELIDKFKDERFDIIIDDGSHAPLDQCWFVNHYTRLLRPDGVLIVEDVLSEATIPALIEVLPEGFQHTAVEMCEGNSQVDSRLFIAWPI